MSQQAEELVKPGQHKNLMSTMLHGWETTTIAGTQLGFLEESGATPLIQISGGSTALSRFVIQHTTVRKVIHWVSVIQEG